MAHFLFITWKSARREGQNSKSNKRACSFIIYLRVRTYIYHVLALGSCHDVAYSSDVFWVRTIVMHRFFIHFSFPPALQIVPVTKKHSSNNSCKNYSLYYNRVVKIMFSIFSLERISTVNHSLISTGYSLWDYFCNLSKMCELVFTIYQCIYWFCKSNCFFYNLIYKTCKYNNNRL